MAFASVEVYSFRGFPFTTEQGAVGLGAVQRLFIGIIRLKNAEDQFRLPFERLREVGVVESDVIKA
ncbi:MAG: hypothetical protein ACR2GR_03965 [Rhodothermales bacterium]